MNATQQPPDFSDAAINAAYKVLNKYAMVVHYNCIPGDPDGCMAAVHERNHVAEAVEAALAASDPIRRDAVKRKELAASQALMRAFR